MIFRLETVHTVAKSGDTGPLTSEMAMSVLLTD
jgi:hypothetical protein